MRRRLVFAIVVAGVMAAAAVPATASAQTAPPHKQSLGLFAKAAIYSFSCGESGPSAQIVTHAGGQRLNVPKSTLEDFWFVEPIPLACEGRSSGPLVMSVILLSCGPSGLSVHLVAPGGPAQGIPGNPDDISLIVAGPGGTGSLALCGPGYGQTPGSRSG